MAILKCPSCSAEISSKSRECIKCGYILDTKTKTGDKIRKKKIFLLSIIILIIGLAFLFILLKSIFFKVKINKDFLEAGEIVNISDIIEPKHSFVSLENEDLIVNTQVIGKVSIPYSLHGFAFSTNKTLEIEVVDTKSPVIKGPDLLTITDSSDINWGELYTVDDFTPSLEEKIKPEGKIPTSDGIYDLVLNVEDAAGNIGKKEIKIEVIKLTKEENIVIQFINELVNKGKYKKESITKLRIYNIDNVSYFFEVNGKDTYYYETKNNSLYTFEVAAILAGYYSQLSSYKLMLKLMLKDIDLTRIQKVM